MQTRRSRTRGSIISEGGLLRPEILDRIRAGDKDLPGITEEAYHLDSGQRLGEATTQSWNRLLGAWATFKDELADIGAEEPATTITRERFLLPLFEELGFGRLQTAKAVEIAERSYPVLHAWAAVPFHLVGANVPLDRRTQGVRGAAGQSPHGLVQELLNRSDERLWGIVSNGRVLRLLRDNVSLTRQAYLEFDLESIMDGEDYADFVLLWLVCHQSRFEGERPESYLIEQLRTAAASSGTRALDRLREGVESAIEVMGQGFLAHPANEELRRDVRSGALTGEDYYRQLLRIAYRLIFLFVAEDRDALLHPDATEEARERFELGYSTARLRRLAAQRRGSRHADLWRSLVVVVNALGGSDGAPSIGLPALGGFLFSGDACPNLDGAQLSNRDLLTAVRGLATIEDRGVTIAVDYRNLGSEELGSIYETLLAYHPELHPDAATFELHSAAGSEKKTTGAYYTPTSLINELLDSALEPVLEGAADKGTPEEAEQAILNVKVVDPAVGSGHFLVGAAHRIARKLASVRTGDEEPAPEAMRTALRDIVGRCLYGVDINPDAAELCRVSLWMEALEPGRPLSFLDSHIRVGNSLLGTTPALLAAGIPDDAYSAISGDDKKVVTELRKHNKAEREGQLGLDEALVETLDATLGSKALEISAMPEDDVEAVAARSERDQSLRTSPEYVESKLLADAWCAAFVVEKRTGAPTITTGTLRRIARDLSSLPAKTIAAIASLATGYRFFHWHLEFPDVFNTPDGDLDENTGWSGGFGVVLGNPPWETVELSDREFFAVRAPEIAAAPTAAKRKKMIAALEHDDPDQFSDYQAALRQSAGINHLVRHSGRCPLTARGKINTYSIFAESMRGLVEPRGRVGCILPTGIATDATTQAFFSDVVTTRALVSLYGFENEAFVFPTVHHAFKFALITMCGRGRGPADADLVYFARSITDLLDPERHFTLSAADYGLLNPNTRTSPTFRGRTDAVLAIQIYRRVPVLVDDAKGDAGNPWGLSFRQGLFNMASDSGNFLDGPGPGRLPLIEAKMIHQFDHRYGTYEGQSQAQANQGALPQPGDREKADPDFETMPKYWVERSAVISGLGSNTQREWLLGWRKITSSVAIRSMVSSVMPIGGFGDSGYLAFSDDLLAGLLVANLNAFVLDWVCRQKQGGNNLNLFIVEQLPVLPPSAYASRVGWADVSFGDWLRPYVVELVATSRSVLPFAKDLGWTGPPFRWSAERRGMLRAEVDAAFFHAYGVGRSDVEHVLESFWIVREKEEKDLGEYRSMRLILGAYDSMAAAIARDRDFVSALDPAPGSETGWRDVPALVPYPSPNDLASGRRESTTIVRVEASSPLATHSATKAERWVAESQIDPTEIVPGAGVRHRVFGEGKVVSIQPGLSPVLTIDFGDEAKLIIYGRGLMEIAVADEGDTG